MHVFNILCKILGYKEIAYEINDHLKIFGKDTDEVDYDGYEQCPFCNSRIDEFRFCACGGNLGVD